MKFDIDEDRYRQCVLAMLKAHWIKRGEKREKAVLPTLYQNGIIAMAQELNQRLKRLNSAARMHNCIGSQEHKAQYRSESDRQNQIHAQHTNIRPTRRTLSQPKIHYNTITLKNTKNKEVTSKKAKSIKGTYFLVINGSTKKKSPKYIALHEGHWPIIMIFSYKMWH